MTITNSLLKTLDRKQWEMVNATPLAQAAGSFVLSSTLFDQLQLYVVSITQMYLYRPDEDAWLQIPTSGIAGTFGAGSCGTFHPNGPTGTATAGGASTITTALTIPGSLAGYKIRITAGLGAGQEKTILSNTYGANSVITVESAWAVNPDNTSVFVIKSGRFWIFVGNNVTQGLRYYDVATNTWSAALSVAGVTATFATDGKMRCTPGDVAQFATDTVTSATSTTLTKTGKSWATNQWTNAQVRIVSGTGAGQIRTIISNTGTVLTVAAWTVTPDATSIYSIEGNDDFIYLAGNAQVALFRYSISGNTWSTLAPGAARQAAPGAGMSLIWVHAVEDTLWTNENAIINGRRLYSFRGAGSADLHYYDIAANTWVTVTYQRQSETFNTGTGWDNSGHGQIYGHKDATSRYFRFDLAKNTMDPLGQMPLPQGAALVGDRLFTVDITDGAEVLTYLYHIRNSSTDMLRMLII